MAVPAKRRATYQDLIDLPENLVGEIIDGELFASPRPASRHALASSVLGSDIGGPFGRGRGGPGGWWILDEPELHLGADVLVPDLAGWRRERMPTIADVPFFTLAPDWVCEVLSPRTARLDLVLKLPKYAAQKVQHAWIVDPVAKTLQIFRLEGEGWRLAASHGGDEVARLEPFEAVELDLSALWLPDAAPA